jgi:hypothetical protein
MQRLSREYVEIANKMKNEMKYIWTPLFDLPVIVLHFKKPPSVKTP